MPEFGFAAEKLVKEGRVALADLKELRHWLEGEAQLPNWSDERLCLFLNSCSQDMQLTKRTIKAYQKVTTSSPELFTERDLDVAKLWKASLHVYFSVLPARTDDNCCIVYHRLKSPKASDYDFTQSVKLLIMTFELALQGPDPPSGMVVLFDMQMVHLMHLLRVKVGVMQKLFDFVQEAIPLKLKEIHVVNTVPFIDKVMSLIRPFMNKELMKLLNFHNKNMNWDKFYADVLPTACLPSDYGGELDDVESLDAINKSRLKEFKEYFLQEQMTRENL